MKKLKSSIFSGLKTRKNKASAYVKKLLCVIRNIFATFISPFAGPHEELQIIYANLRV